MKMKMIMKMEMKMKMINVVVQILRLSGQFVFFMKDILSVTNTNKKHLSNIEPNISISKKAFKLTFNQIFLKAKKLFKHIVQMKVF